MEQVYEQYTDESHKVWELLYKEQIEILATRATKKYIDGIKKIEFVEDKIPRFTFINQVLKELTGWQVYPVPGIIDNKPFFQLLAQKKFPATTWMRRLAQLKYIEEPDMFHDVFGHVPLLSEPYFASFLSGLSEIALEFIDSPSAVELMARVYWYTVEFGLIKENNELRIYGAGILSSPGESVYALSDKPIHFEFDLDKVLETPYIKDKYQEQYFVAVSYEQLHNQLPRIHKRIKEVVDLEIEIKEGQRFLCKDLLINI
ncbi:MAG: phenylalanine 4-monooxygenase [Saprospiraceae bacterium]|nr:phenylalanine 4-monooxygenase [Saprospiraceae bacterium]